MEKNKVAIIGATGLVGQTFLYIIKDDIDKYELKLYASINSSGRKLKIANKYYIVNSLDDTSFDDVDYACFFADAEISKIYIPIALSKGVKVIDNSSFFRLKDEVLLIVNGVNDYLINLNSNLISNPNCCVIQSMMVVSLLKEYGIKKVMYNTYQSVSGSGKQGIDDLLRCRKGLLPLFYETDISFTCIPKIGEYKEDGFTDEEHKIINETKKVLDDQDIDVVASCVRVPVMFSHGVAVQIELEKPFELHEIKNKIKKKENLVYCDKIVPSSVLSCKNDKVYVGRLRKHNNSLLFYCVADNIRVGAATNAYNILKKLVNMGDL